MFRQVTWAMLATALGIIGCSAPRGPIEVTNPDPSGKIPAMKKAVREHDLKVVRQLVKDLDSDDPAVRLFAIQALEKLTGQRYGYEYYADEVQRKPALSAWQVWLGQAGGVPTPPPGGGSPPRGG